MPLREDLLQPIPGDNPSGKSLKYDRVYDQIKEARAEEDSTIPSGAWERQAKRADTKIVIKLAGEALATKSKDLQLAVWLGEAHIKQEGAPLLQPVLTLCLELQKSFWPSIYPEIDEGDVGLRAVPLQWAANRYAALVYDLPLTRSGINFHAYKSARALGYEADAANNEAKRKARTEALKRGNLTAEDADTGIAGTPKSFYADLDTALQDARDVLEDLALFCEEQYGDDGPTFRKLRDSLDEVHNLVNSLLNEKRAIEPDIVEVSAPEPDPVFEPAAVAPVQHVAPSAVQVAAAPIAAPTQAIAAAAPTVSSPSATPQSWDDACARVQACATYMHTQRAGSSVPYLLHTAIRWGELRKHGAKPPLDVLVAPPSEIRSGLKMAYTEKAWGDLLGRCMAAFNDASARCWLDLHRYLWASTKESGYQPFAAMIVKSVHAILSDYPEMPQWTFMDDTAVANADTLKWIEETVRPVSEAVEVAPPPAPVISAPSPIEIRVAVPEPAGSDSEEDAFVQAASLAAGGQLGAATALLARDASQQPSGRMRYSRRMQIAELCLAGGSSGVALPILRELIEEMERRNLESWETGEMLTKPISLLLRSQNGSMDSADRNALFTRLCRVDPSAALSLTE